MSPTWELTGSCCEHRTVTVYRGAVAAAVPWLSGRTGEHLDIHGATESAADDVVDACGTVVAVEIDGD
jgi:hypothetical protein